MIMIMIIIMIMIMINIMIMIMIVIIIILSSLWPSYLYASIGHRVSIARRVGHRTPTTACPCVACKCALHGILCFHSHLGLVTACSCRLRRGPSVSQSVRQSVGFHLGALKERKVAAKTIPYERYGKILFQKVALSYLLHFVQDGCSNNVLDK